MNLGAHVSDTHLWRMCVVRTLAHMTCDMTCAHEMKMKRQKFISITFLSSYAASMHS